MSSAPRRAPPAAPPASLVEARAFVEGAPGKETMPWQEAHVRDDLRKPLYADLPERLMLKLEYVARVNKKTKRLYLEEVLDAALNAELQRRGLGLE